MSLAMFHQVAESLAFDELSVLRAVLNHVIHRDATRCESLGGKWRDLFLVSAVASLALIRLFDNKKTWTSIIACASSIEK